MHRPVMWLLLLSVAGSGCWWQRKPPFAQSPVLRHYKPTLSDSATILAELQARRGPEKPPMPTSSSDESAVEPVNRIAPSLTDGSAASGENPLPPPSEPPSQDHEPRPITRASGQTSSPPGLAKVAPTSDDSVVAPSPSPPDSTVVAQSPVRSFDRELPPSVVKKGVPVVELPEGLAIVLENDRPAGEPTARESAERPKPTAIGEDLPSPPNTTRSRRTVAGNFGHDPDRSWLQGILERHHRGYYCLRYCDPSVEDEWGGKVRLVEDERLQSFRNGDVIGVIGRMVEPAELSPLYRIDDIWLVRAR